MTKKSKDNYEAPSYPSGLEVEALRLQHGYSQTAFGALLGDSIRSVQMWEHGERLMNPIKWAYVKHILGAEKIAFGVKAGKSA